MYAILAQHRHCQLCQVCCRQGSGRVWLGDDHCIQHRIQRSQHSLGIFVCQNSQHTDQRAEFKGLGNGCRQGLRAMRIVSGIDNDGGVPAQYLKAPRAAHLLEAFSDHVVADSVRAQERLDSR